MACKKSNKKNCGNKEEIEDFLSIHGNKTKMALGEEDD
jgi:hypothetical protein